MLPGGLGMSFALAGMAAGALALRGIWQMNLGLRAQAMDSFESAGQVFLTALSVFLAMWAASVATLYFIPARGQLTPLQVIERSWGLLDDSVNVFYKHYNWSITYIREVAWTRAVIGIIPVVGELQDVIGSGTMPANWMFTFSSNIFWGLAVYAKFISLLHPWLLPLGAGLACVPRLNRLGGFLLALYLVAASGVVVAAAQTSLLNELETDDAIPRFAAADYVNPAAYNNYIEEVNNRAREFFHAALYSLLTIAVASAVAVAASSAFGGLSTFLRPGF